MDENDCKIMSEKFDDLVTTLDCVMREMKHIRAELNMPVDAGCEEKASAKSE